MQKSLVLFAKGRHTGTKLGKEKEFKENLGGVMRVKLSAHKTIFVISGKREKNLKFIVTFCSLYFQL